MLYTFNAFLLANVLYFDVRHHDRLLQKYGLVTSEIAESIVIWLFLYAIVQVPNAFTYFLVGFRDDFVYYCTFTWSLLWVIAVFYSLTKVLYSLTHNISVAITIMCFCQEVSLAISGYYVFPAELPSWIAWLRFASPTYYAYETVVLSIADNRVVECGKVVCAPARDGVAPPYSS